MPPTADKGRGLTQKADSDHTDLIVAGISALAAAIVMSFVASVGKPGGIHVLLAIAAVFAIVWAYLMVARSSQDSAWKAGTVIGAGVIGALCLVGLSKLLG
jgi:hypothetical protein